MVSKRINQRILCLLIYLCFSQISYSQNQWIEFKNSEERVEATIFHNPKDVPPFRYLLNNSSDTINLLSQDVKIFFYSKNKRGDILFYSLSTKESGDQFFQKKIDNQLKIFENYSSKALYIMLDNDLVQLKDKYVGNEILEKILPYEFKLKSKSIKSEVGKLEVLDQLIQNNIKKYPDFYIGVFGSIYSNNLDYEYTIRTIRSELPFLGEYFNQDQTFEIQNVDVGMYGDLSIVPAWELELSIRAYLSRQDIKNINYENNYTSSMNGQVDYVGMELVAKKVYSLNRYFPFLDLGIGFKYKIDSNLDFAEYTAEESITRLKVSNPDIMPNYLLFTLGVGIEIPYTSKHYILARISIDQLNSSFKTGFVIPRLTIGLNIL